jgi:hypothetical protein
MSIDKSKYFEQVEQLVTNKSIPFENFSKLYEIASSDNSNNADSSFIVDKIVNLIFYSGYGSEVTIPWSFFDTEIGKALLYVKYNLNIQDIYFVNDIADVTGFSKQYIVREASAGRIKGIKRGGNWVFLKDDVNNYLIKKDLKSLYPTNEEVIIEPGFERTEGYNSKKY